MMAIPAIGQAAAALSEHLRVAPGARDQLLCTAEPFDKTKPRNRELSISWSFQLRGGATAII